MRKFLHFTFFIKYIGMEVLSKYTEETYLQFLFDHHTFIMH